MRDMKWLVSFLVLLLEGFLLMLLVGLIHRDVPVVPAMGFYASAATTALVNFVFSKSRGTVLLS